MDRVAGIQADLDRVGEAESERLGFGEVLCTRVAWSAGERITGDLAGGNCYGARKLERLAAALGERERLNLTAYTDHHSDLPLLEWVDHAVVVNGTQKLSREARIRGYDTQDW